MSEWDRSSLQILWAIPRYELGGTSNIFSKFSMHVMLNRFLGGMLGMAVGDALGTKNECVPRERCVLEPVTEMMSGGRYSLHAGQFTDDTSMALCLAESLILSSSFNAPDVISKWHSWYTSGHLSSNGRCFDIGATTVKALLYCYNSKKTQTKQAISEICGNGSLMRVLPVILYGSYNFDHLMDICEKSSIITHTGQDGIDACKYYGAMIHQILTNPKITKKELLAENFLTKFYPNYFKKNPIKSKNIKNIIEKCEYKKKEEKDIKGTGRCDFSLETVLYCFYHTKSFEEGLIKVVNLGDDADTTGCIFGELAGVYYSLKGIPKRWLDKLCLKKLIEVFTKELYELRMFKSDSTNEKRKFETSKEFQRIYYSYMFLEDEYKPVQRRMKACPTMYRNIKQFDDHIAEVKKKYFLRKEKKSEFFSDEMWKEFEIRFSQNREFLENKFFVNKKKKIPKIVKKIESDNSQDDDDVDAPPPPPGVDELNFEEVNDTVDDENNDGSMRNNLLKEIREGLKLRKVKKK